MSTSEMMLKIKYGISPWASAESIRILSALGEPISVECRENNYILYYLEGYIRIFNTEFSYKLRYSSYNDGLTNDLDEVLRKFR